MPATPTAGFTVRKVIDRQQEGLSAASFLAPASWRDHSSVVWNYANYSQPVAISIEVHEPGTAAAFFSYPTVDLFWLRPAGRFYRPGQNVGCLLYGQPISPQSALTGFVQHARGNSADFRIRESHGLPDLPRVLHLTGNDHPRALSVEVTYVDGNGQPLEEEFFAVYYSVDIPYDGPQGRMWQTNWGLKAVHSFRAPQGGLDARQPLFAAIAKSFWPNPQWVQRYAAVNKYLAAQFNRNLQAGYGEIAAAAQLSKQISSNNDAMIASIDTSLRAPSHPAARSSNLNVDGYDEYLRGVDTAGCS